MSKKKVLVVHYSQTGQMTRIVKSVVQPLLDNEEVEVSFEELKPVKPYPFPWTALQFFDAFPESVEGIPSELQPFSFNPDEHFDLIILAYQPWYLSPSIPVSSFLQSPEAKKVMQDKPVVTVIGCRNMWLGAQEEVKKYLKNIGARLVGNMAMFDRAGNLTSVLTIIGWLIKGKQEGFLGLPRSGVSEEDIKGGVSFGEVILDHLLKGEVQDMQHELNRKGAVTINPSLMILEARGRKMFKIWSKFLLARGGAGDPRRRFRVKLFMVTLPTGILILSPITTLSTILIRKLRRKYILQQMGYFSQNKLKD